MLFSLKHSFSVDKASKLKLTSNYNKAAKASSDRSGLLQHKIREDDSEGGGKGAADVEEAQSQFSQTQVVERDHGHEAERQRKYFSRYFGVESDFFVLIAKDFINSFFDTNCMLV